MTTHRIIGPTINHANLTREEVHFLRDHGIVLCSQCQDLAKYLTEQQTRRVFGCGTSEAAERMAAGLRGIVPEGVATALTRHRFEPRPQNGIAGPVEDSPALAQRRYATRDQRQAITAVLNNIDDDDLPAKMLLLDYCPAEVGDQGHLGACVGWGAAATREYLCQQRLSPGYMYAGAKYIDGRPDIVGSWQQCAFEFCTRYGALLETEYPYTDNPSPDYFDIGPYFKRAARFRAQAYVDCMLEHGNVQLMPRVIKALLAGALCEDIGPQTVSISLSVFPSWNSASASLYGMIPIPFDGEERIGGHAMSAVGYIDARDPSNPFDLDFFIVRNSWGKKWAEQNPFGFAGHALIPAGYFARSDLLLEALIFIAEPSPVCSSFLRQLLSSAWDESLLAPAPSLIAL